MSTERQDREREKLIYLEDYTDLIKSLDELAGDVSNGEVIDKQISKSIACVGRALRDKVKYIVNFSKSSRKKQGFFARRRDLKLEKQLEKQERELEELEVQHQKAILEKKNKQIASSQAETKALECTETDENPSDEEKVDPNTQENTETEVLDF